ncbi:uncharacterized protein (DUF58 family) [Deinococcus metalli]|uniref:Uncharacterized protein (DUF58 family) n=1 Tax=Deinococcus metalli TaxID=1141878 RepID=A0A7W8KAH5_9DEIO|nr:DUF58 domain-containing protein [Deinococcus metalli]MBB5374679.1 uncharacterized protein (DUF58 family) [Deinococcus metalli]GHF34506.1 hypothetical protein GCM10017781_09180 [Deinococcus metalli]
MSALLVWLVVIALLTALLWLAYSVPPAVTLSRDLPDRAFQGTRTPLGVRVELHSRLPLRFALDDPTPRAVVPDVPVTLVGAGMGTVAVDFHTTLDLNRRGVHAWPGATLRWADPLGLFWRAVPVPAPQGLLVYPGTHGLVLPELLRPLLSEGGLSRRLGLDDPLSLRGVREYVSGDPPGRVHWRLSARTGTLTVRDPERTAASSVAIYVDTGAGTDVYLESAVRLAASLVQEALGLTLPVSVALPGSASPAGTTGEAVQGALRLLARAALNPGDPAVPPTRTGGNLFILTARPRPALIEQAMRARAHASRVVIVALPEGFYLEPGETPRRQWSGLPDVVRDLERQAGALAGAGILVYILRGNQSVLKLGA